MLRAYVDFSLHVRECGGQMVDGKQEFVHWRKNRFTSEQIVNGAGKSSVVPLQQKAVQWEVMCIKVPEIRGNLKLQDYCGTQCVDFLELVVRVGIDNFLAEGRFF